MIDTAKDNLRIEVRDSDEKAHLETICRSPNAMGSLSDLTCGHSAPAGHAVDPLQQPASPRKIPTSGEMKILQTIIDGCIHAALAIALGDLRSWHTACLVQSCSQHVRAEPANLITH